MDNNWLKELPESCHAGVNEALVSAFGARGIDSAEPVLGGASGALAYRIGIGTESYLLRLEARPSPLRNPHQYECMRIASEAGIAPRLHYSNDAAGMAIMDFIAGYPLSSYPGGQSALAVAMGELVGRLQATDAFPVLGDYRVFVSRMLGYLKSRFAPGLLDEHHAGFDRIRDAYPWNADRHVSSHNDPNPRNILFDGKRLWLIDWETSYRNDAFTDIAIVIENHAPDAEIEDTLMAAWLGRAPDRLDRAKVKLMRQMTKVYYAGLLFASLHHPAAPMNKGAEPIASLLAPTADEFRAQLATGELKPTAVETRVILGKMLLAGFVADICTQEFEDAITVCKGG